MTARFRRGRLIVPYGLWGG